MNPIIFAVIAVAVIGLICSVVLAIASKVMAVPVNETEQKVRECLPGANCGACGYAGCDGYAAALASGEETKTNKCIPGSDGVAKLVAGVLGVEAEDVIEQVALVHCLGTCDVTKDKMNYQGIESCKAAKLFYGGRGSCTYGCLGIGDCMNVCPQNAIYMDKGIAHVDNELCIGCGLCAKTCPNGIITLVPDVIRTMVTCNNHDKGAVTRKVCSHGCIGCMKCVKNCPAEAISVVSNLAVIDYTKCQNCGKCAEVCVTGCIMEADFKGIWNTNDPDVEKPEWGEEKAED
ncbi:MAG: RnfABCDGE type electron transport complex subunit B [Parasporobacterium sp.]|nr:RnfABCDGE type electron transport complex subunit B [Parasporobacterium sp.]